MAKNDFDLKEKEQKKRVEQELLGLHMTETSSWRILKIMSELVSGFDLLHKYGLAATFFGSARIDDKHPWYEKAQKLAGLLSKDGFTIITGGASGVMEAANRGAYEAKGNSVGLNIHLNHKQDFNPYLTDSQIFEHFFTRKLMLSFASEVYVFFPGGFGTLDEFFEILTLVQTKKIGKIPIVLVGASYWTPLLEWFNTSLYHKHKTVGSEDLALYTLVDSVEEAHETVCRLVKEEFAETTS